MRKQGFSLIEIILATAIFLIFAPPLVIAAIGGLDLTASSENVLFAGRYASEGLEALRSIRDRSYEDLGTTSETGLSLEEDGWVLSGSEDTSGIFTRTVRIEDVRRDGDGDIVESGWPIDPDMRRVIVSVSWHTLSGAETSVEVSSYLSNWRAPY